LLSPPPGESIGEGQGERGIMAGAGLAGRQIAAVAAGNALEFYDFVTYSFFAVQIGHSLFPGDDAHKLIFSLATFGVGFVSRPLGGLIIGRIADRRGRKPAMILSFSLMGIAITGLALTPSYAAIGMAAPALAVLFRLIQGFALGGEVGPNAAFLLEAAPPHRRGLYLSIHAATADLAVLVAGLVGFGLSSWLAPAALDAWGWRIALLIGAAIVPFGLALRRRLEETLPAEAAEPAAPGSLRPFLIVAGAGMLVLGAATISNYTLSYLTTYAQDTLHMAVPAAFGATVVLGLISVVADLASGWLADRYGRKRVLILPWLLLIAAAVPAFTFLSAMRTPTALLGATAVLTTFHILGSTPALLLFIEALPARIRAGALGIIYALAIAIFGGTTQLVVKALIGWTGSAVAPGWYMMIAVLGGFAGILMIREAPRPAKP
jgi:MFS transporter, MHS family, citrate/tricarballylate:H+ symporter